MEKIVFLEYYIKNINSGQVNEIEENNIINSLNELSVLDPKCLSEDDYKKLIKYWLLLANMYNDRVLSAGCNVIASLCTDDLARNYFGEKIIISTANILKSLTNRSIKDKCTQECLLQTCRAIGNLCYYHEENTMHALNEGCLITTMEVLKTNTEENLQPVLIGLLLNLTHLDDYNYKFPDNMIEELNLFGIRYMKYNNNYGQYINLISIMINIVKKSSSYSKITNYEKCSLIDCLLEKYSIQINITSICVKFIKQVSKTYNIYNWILKGKHKLLIQILDKYEENEEEDAKIIVKKICNIIILLSNDDGSMDNSKQLEVLFLVEWLLLKVYSSSLYIKLSAVRALGNFSRFKYESNNSNINPASIIMKKISWFINTLEKSVKDKNSLMEISIYLCLFKNILCVTNFNLLDDNEKNKLIKTTIEVLKYTTFNPIIEKSLDVIERIIQKGGISQKQLVLYKSPIFIQLVTKYCNCANEDINILAKKLLFSINEKIKISEIDILQSIEEDLQIKD